MRQKRTWDEIAGILFLTASLVMLGLSVYLCAGSDIWYDELFTMGLGNQSLGDLVSITARDVHPPLYYILVKFVLGFAGEGYEKQVTAAKLLSCLPFLLCICYGLTKVRKHFGLLTAGLFCFLVLSMPQLAGYTVEIRMYGFALLFVTACMLYAYELTLDGSGENYGKEQSAGAKDRKCGAGKWAALTGFALAACYTHYYACVAAGMVYVCLFLCLLKKKLLQRKLLPFLISGGVCCAGYLPWLLLVVREQLGRVKENYWIEGVSLRTLGGCAKFLLKPSFDSGGLNWILAAVLFVLCGTLFLKALWGCCKKKDDRDTFIVGSGAVLAGLIIFGMGASLLIRPVFVYRYMLPAMGVFWLGIAVAVSALKKKYLVVPLLLLFGVIGLRDYRAFYGEETGKQLQMQQALEKLKELGERDQVIFNFAQAQGVVNYYMERNTLLWYEKPEELIQEMFPGDKSLVEGEFSDEAGISRIRELLEQGETLWFFGSGRARDEILEKWRGAGISAKPFGEAMIERYWFDLYRLYPRESFLEFGEDTKTQEH